MQKLMNKWIHKWNAFFDAEMNMISGIAILIAMLAIAIVLMLMAGCNGGSKGSYQGEKRDQRNYVFKYDAEGRPTLNVFTDNGLLTYANGQTTAPPNAKEPSKLTLGDNGVSTDIAGQYEAQAINYVKKNYQTMTYVGLACILAGVVLIFLPWAKITGFSALGLPLIGTGIFFNFLPVIIDTIGVPVAILILIGLIGAGFLYLWAHRSGIKKEAAAAQIRVSAAAASLSAAGQGEAATILRRVTNPTYNAAYTGAKTAQATAQVMAGDPLAGAVPTASIVQTPTTAATIPVDVEAAAATPVAPEL